MSQPNRYEQQFLTELKAVFIGAQVEGDSGFINLMRIKARYFELGVFPQLRKDIDAACAPFEAGFREELFDKLYDFFSRYFSESGSIYFRHTAPHQSVYERVYTDDRDVMLFWKTHMLYYVKTDRLFNNMAVTVDGQRFFFDVAGLEHKRANNGRRKYILVEMGEHFYSVILPRIKKVAFSDKWKNGKAVPGGQGMSHFVKYYDLEQYEETLRRAHYADALPLAGSDPYTSYVFLRDLKLLDAVTVDVAQNSVAVDLSRLYPDIDLAETLSCLTGKSIKRITAAAVEFQDGSSASLAAPDWATVKPLIWW